MSDPGRTGVPSPVIDDGTVVAIKRGKFKFYSERSGGRPYNNCLICAGMIGCRWQGYAVPDSYDDVIRSAIPLPNNGGGTDLAEVRNALAKLFAHPPSLEHLGEADFLAGLPVFGGRGKGSSVYATIVDTTNLPAHFQRLVGQNYDALHGIAVVAKSGPDAEVPLVYICDTMGKKAPGEKDDPLTFVPYTYEQIEWGELKPALYRSAGATDIDVLRFVKNVARQPVAA